MSQTMGLVYRIFLHYATKDAQPNRLCYKRTACISPIKFSTYMIYQSVPEFQVESSTFFSNRSMYRKVVEKIMSSVAMSRSSNGAREKTRRKDFRYVSHS